jgi:hypothetical protein
MADHIVDYTRIRVSVCGKVGIFDCRCAHFPDCKYPRDGRLAGGVVMTFDEWYASQEEKHGTPPFACSYDAAKFAWQSSIQENALQALSDMAQESAVKESLTTESLISESAIKETGSNLEQDHCEDKLEMVQPAAPADIEKELKSAKFHLKFCRDRLDALQKWQSKMRDPERTIVCDILANGFRLEPALRELSDSEILNIVTKAPALNTAEEEWLYVARAVIAAATNNQPKE